MVKRTLLQRVAPLLGLAAVAALILAVVMLSGCDKPRSVIVAPCGGQAQMCIPI